MNTSDRDVTFAEILEERPTTTKDINRSITAKPDDFRKSIIKKRTKSKIYKALDAMTVDEKLLLGACANGNVDKVYELLWKGTNANVKMPVTGYTYQLN